MGHGKRSHERVEEAEVVMDEEGEAVGVIRVKVMEVILMWVREMEVMEMEVMLSTQ